MPFADAIRIGASGASSYEVERSLRFNKADDVYLTRTPSSTGNQKVWTFSAWIKRTNISNDYHYIYSAHSGSDYFALYIENDKLHSYFSPGNNYGEVNSRRFRDVGAWFHIVHQVDAANTTQRIWINNVELSLNSGRNPSNSNFPMNESGVAMIVGNASWWLDERASDMYLAEVHYSDGNKYTPSDFIETDAITGQLIPKKVDITYGTNGYYLNFSDNSGTSATTLGKDSSGNGNNFTPTNFSVSAGIGNDSVIDTPTNNFCTYNPLNQTNSVNLTEGNLKFSQSANDQAVTGTMAITSGKWYYEFLKVSGDNPEVGITAIDSLNPATNGQKVSFSGASSGDITGFKIALITNNGQQRNGIDYGDPGAVSLTGGSAQTGAGYIGIAIDMDNSKIWYTDLSGNYFNSGNPATGANAAYDFSSTRAANGATPFIYFATASGDTGSVNFGQQPFNHTQPTGFKSICSANLADPSIKLPNKHFGTLLYSSGSSNGTFNFTDSSSVDFLPDWTWIKCRSAGERHRVIDVVRGNQNVTGDFLLPDGNDNETVSGVDGTTVSSIQNGIRIVETTIGSGEIYFTNRDYVTWNWKAGGSASSNSDGSITASLSANPTAGFSIVGYTGNGASSATIGHGLGVAPKAFVVKSRDQARGWNFYHHIIGNTKYIHLQQNHTPITNSDWWNDTSPTSSVFTVGTDNDVNDSSQDYIAYCFSEVEGYSKFESYTGSGSNNGTFVYTGFRPAFLIIKKTSGTGNWAINDIERDNNTEYGNDASIYANTSDAETTSSSLNVDFLSNGFKLRSDNSSYNGSGGTYIYFAFAESPFKYARAR